MAQSPGAGADATGVLASAAKLMPAPFTELVKLLGSVIVAPPLPRSGRKPVMPMLMRCQPPKEDPLLKLISVLVLERLVPPL